MEQMEYGTILTRLKKNMQDKTWTET